MTDVGALTFDVFGTVVDWRGTIIREASFLAEAKGLSGDWAATSVDPQATTYGTLVSLALVGVVFVTGFVLIWLYAAIRPRFGPGPRTAVIAGLTLWLIAWALMGLSLSLSDLVTARVALISALWGLFEVPLAALAGAWLYREDRQTGDLEKSSRH